MPGPPRCPYMPRRWAEILTALEVAAAARGLPPEPWPCPHRLPA